MERLPTSLAALGLFACGLLLLSAWVAAARRRGAVVSAAALLAASLAPPLAFTLVVALSAHRFGDLRIALEGVRFAMPARVSEVRIGGSQEADHVVVRDLPPGFLTLRPGASGELLADIHPAVATARGAGREQAAGGRRAFGMVRLGSSRTGTFANTAELREGSRIAIAGGPMLTFAGGALGPAADDYALLPSRTNRYLGLPMGRQLAPEVEVFPLRYWGVPVPARIATATAAGSPAGAAAAGAHRELRRRDWEARALTAEGGAPLGTFLFRAGGYLRRGWRLALTDPAVTLQPAAGGAPQAFSARVAALADGEERRFALYRVDYHPPAGEGDARSRIQERRSFRARWRDGILQLTFDSPSFVRVRHADLAGGPKSGRDLLMVGSEESLAVIDRTKMLLHFPILGEPFAGELFARIEPQGDRMVATTHTGSRSYPLGAGFAVGADAAAILRVGRLGVPWGAVLVGWVAAATALAAGWTLRRRPIPLILLSGVELFLAVRLLVAYQGAFLDPGAADATWTSLAALVWVPFALQAALAIYAGDQPLQGHLLHLAVCFVSVAAIFRAARAEHWVLGLCLPPVAAVALGWGLRGLDRLARRLPGWQPGAIAPTTRWELVLLTAAGAVAMAAGLFLAWLGEGWQVSLMAAILPVIAAMLLLGAGMLVHAVALPGGSSPGAEDRRAVWTSLSLMAAIAGVRLVTLIAVGWKERIDLGVQVLAVSIWYTPAVVLVFALVLGRRLDLASLGLFALAFVVLFGVPVVAHDWGTALIFSLPEVLLLTVVAFATARTPKARLGLAVAVAAVALLVGVFLVDPVNATSLFAATPSEKEWAAAAASPDVARELLAKNLEAGGGNALRVWSWAAPEVLQRLGTDSAESLLVVMKNLSQYGSRGWAGEGFLMVPLPTALTATHLDDNLSAVHLLGTFGWLGTLAVLLPLAAWMVLVPWVSTGGRLTALDPRRAFGILLVWTVAFAGLYMVSANVGLLLFTGKNVYFLAAHSTSDVFEGTLLVLLALWAFSTPQASRP